MTGLVWPDARLAVHTLCQGFEVGGQTVEAFYILPDHFETENLPCVNTYVQRSSEGYIDRVTWVVVDVYAAPGESIGIAEALVSAVANRPHDVPGVGYLDSVEVEQIPTDVPRPSGFGEQAQMILRVTTRPVS